MQQITSFKKSGFLLTIPAMLAMVLPPAPQAASQQQNAEVELAQTVPAKTTQAQTAHSQRRQMERRPKRQGFDPILTQQLVVATGRWDYKTVKSLVLQNVDVNVRARANKTPLILAIEHGDNATVKLLLDKGANPNVPIEVLGRETPLMVAVQKSNVEAVELLLAHGADVLTPEAHGWTALDMARRCMSIPCHEQWTDRQKLLIRLLREAALRQRSDVVLPAIPPISRDHHLFDSTVGTSVAF